MGRYFMISFKSLAEFFPKNLHKNILVLRPYTMFVHDFSCMVFPLFLQVGSKLYVHTAGAGVVPGCQFPASAKNNS